MGHSYTRYWSGCNSVFHMTSSWAEAVSQMYAFCEHSEADFEEVRRFRKMTCCLFSLLHAVALDEIRGPEYQEMELHIVHWDLLDRRSRETLRQSPNRVQLSMQWLERCIVR